MRLSKSDIVAASIGTAILAVLLYLLYADIMDRSGGGKTKLIGKITAKTNKAERKFSSQVVWDGVYKGTSLYNYDTIRTADHSQASIRLIDGTVITLNENSMILLSLSEKEVDIKFIQGTMSASQSDVKGSKAQKVNIESGDSKISLRGSDISLSQDRDNQLQMTVNRGKATLNTGKEEKVINENQNIIAGKDTIRLYDLSIKLISPENNRFVASTANKTMVNFSWERLRGNYTVNLEIAANPAVSDPLVRVKANGANAAVKLTDGVYYWRVAAIHNETKKIESSETRKFSVVNSRPVNLISPANNSVFKYRDAKPMINFIWSRNESVSRYKLIVSGRADLGSPLLNTTVDGNKISLDNLGQSTYFWKVVNISENDQIDSNAESPVYTFMVSKTDTIEPPLPISPSENKSVHPRAITQKGLNFTWSKDPSIIDTKLTIAEDRLLTKAVINKSSRDNSIRMNERLKEGTYYWSLRGVLSDGTMTGSSNTLSFKVAETGGIQLIEPINKAIIVNPKNEDSSSVNFSWSKTDLEGKYIVQVSKTMDFASNVKETSVSDLSAVIPAITTGLYYWRVRMVDEKNENILSSQVQSFEVVSLLDSPVVMGPLAGSTVNMLKKNTLDFFWKPVRGANLYRIDLFQVKGGIHRAVATFETRNTAYRFATLNKLDEGRFMWALQAIETEAVTNRMKRRSEEVRSVFDITLGIKKDLKIDSDKILNTE